MDVFGWKHCKILPDVNVIEKQAASGHTVVQQTAHEESAMEELKV